MFGTLYLLPTFLGDDAPAEGLAPLLLQTVGHSSHWLVENLRTARRHLRKAGYQGDFNALHFFEIGKGFDPVAMGAWMEPLRKGFDMVVMSEAGSPAIADPGNACVALAHQWGVRVVPLPGPSSILQTLMASGFNGQQFSFHGYLPIHNSERQQCLRRWYGEQQKTGYTQLFMETPFRSARVLDDVKAALPDHALLCIGIEVGLPSECIVSQPISKWLKKPPELHKKLCIFALGAFPFRTP